MTLSTAGKNWLAINAGVNNCFSPTGVSFVDADGVPFTMGTKDVVITFIGAGMVGKNDAIIIANTSYNGFKAINGSALSYADATWVNNNDGHGGLPQYCAPPAQIISTTLWVDTNDCVAPCTVGGTVSWTNNGGSPGTLDPAILVNTIPTSLGTAVTIGIGETKSYTFSLPDLAAGTYTIQASPNAGTAPKTITVRTPANIVSTGITAIPRILPCVQSCTVDVSVIWTNNGGTAGSFIPSIKVDGTPISPAYSSESLAPGASIEHTFVTDVLTVGSHQICADPNGTCATINIYSGPSIAATGIIVDKTSCTSPCDVTIDVTWTNTGDVDGTFTPSINIDSMHIPLSPETLTVGMSVTHTFGPITLVAGTYNICADPDSGTCVIVNVLTPANVISAILTVDTTDCVTPCTVGGTVSWRNDGGTASAPINLGITVNGTPTTLVTGVTINPGETTATYPFSLSDLAAGTYVICASPDSGTTCKTVVVRTPANVISATLAVDTTDCVAPCTVGGTVSWTNNGGSPSSPINLSISYNGNSIPVASAVIINPGETLPYTFSIPGLTAGTYVVQASPNAGTTPKTIIVRTPANITTTNITLTPSTCSEPCNISIDVTYMNAGQSAGPFTPEITVDGVSVQLTPDTLGPGASIVKTFTLADKTVGTYTICAVPLGVTTCQTLTVTIPRAAEAGMGLIVVGLAVGMILLARKKDKEKRELT